MTNRERGMKRCLEPAEMSIGISTCVFRESWRENLGVLKDAGIRYVEVCATEKREVDVTKPGEAQEIKRLLDSWQLSVWSVHGPWPGGWEGPGLGAKDRNARAECLATMRQGIEFTAALGAKIMVVDKFGWSKNEQDRTAITERSIESLQVLAGDAAKFGVVLGIENVFCPVVPITVLETRKMMERVASPWVRIVLDTGHQHLMKENIMESVQCCGKELVSLHIDDNQGSAKDVMDGNDDQHLPPGEGSIDWPAFMKALRKVDYQGVLMFEVAGGSDPVRRVAVVAQIGLKMMEM